MFDKKLKFLWFLLRLLCLMSFIGIIRGVIVSEHKTITTNYCNIYDRNGFLLAYTNKIYELSIIPEEITNHQLIYKLVWQYITKEKFEQIILSKKTTVIFIGNQKPKIIKERGLLLTSKNERHYPLGQASTTIGFLDESKGLYKGIETLTKNRREDLHTTIDWRIQKQMALILEKAVKQHNADYAFGILVNLDGEIEAMHSTVSCSPKNPHDFINPITVSSYEFASVSKLLTSFAYLNIINPSAGEDTLFDLSTGMDIAGRHVPDTKALPNPPSLKNIIANSSNIGTIAIAKILKWRLFEFLKRLKLLEPIEFETGITTKPRYNAKTLPDILTMSYGYSYQTTVLNMVRALLSIINRGKLITPRILKETKKKVIGSINDNKSLPIIQNIFKATAAQHPLFKRMGIGSKTGTAEIWSKDHYQKDHHNCFMVCFIPDSKGVFKYVLFLGLIDPKPARLAGVLVSSACFDCVLTITTIKRNEE